MQVIRLKGALNEKEMELIELREQHMQLVVSMDSKGLTSWPCSTCQPKPTAKAGHVQLLSYTVAAAGASNPGLMSAAGD